MVLKRPLEIFNGFGGDHHHWMVFGGLTIAINGFSMVFGFATIAFNGFRWFWTIGQMMRWFRWIVVVYTHSLTDRGRCQEMLSQSPCSNHFEAILTLFKWALCSLTFASWPPMILPPPLCPHWQVLRVPLKAKSKSFCWGCYWSNSFQGKIKIFMLGMVRSNPFQYKIKIFILWMVRSNRQACNY